MTKKLICPKCKVELKYVREHAKEYRIYSWVINQVLDEVDIYTHDCYESNTEFFECPECNYEGQALVDFIVGD